MSKIEDLIRQYCPNGCEWKRLGDVGTFYGGITGKAKADFENGNAKFISYKNVYSNFAVDQNTSDRVMIRENENQRSLQYGDICFTGSSETPDECGFSSVVTSVPAEPLYLNSFSFFFRFHDLSGINPDYMKYLFRLSDLRYQIGKTANGVTRFNVSKELMKNVIIPIPPLPIQKEIVRILDEFTELEKELEMRKKQYEFYRDKLLMFGDGVERKTIRDVCLKIVSGGTPKSSRSDYYGGNHPWLRTQEVNFNQIDETSMTITDDGLNNSSAQYIPAWSVIVAMYGATVGRVAYNSIPLTTNQACCNLIIDDKKVIYKYVFYWLSSQYEYIKSLGRGSQTNINADTVKNLDIPVPSLQEQQRIVEILDTFDTLTTNLTKGLPAEIKMRRMQYECYRDYLFGLLK